MRRLLLLILLSAATMDSKQDKDNSPLEKVLKLNRGNFDRALRKHKQLLVHFCKNCGETPSLVSGDLNRSSR